MNNITTVTTVLAEIEDILQGADSPIRTLYQRYRVADEELRETFVLAMIEKLFEKHHRLPPWPRSSGNWMKW